MIGFLVAEFPKRSETFVLREFLGLARSAAPIAAAAFRPGDPGSRRCPDDSGHAVSISYLNRGHELAASAVRLSSFPALWRVSSRLRQRGEARGTTVRRVTRACAVAAWCRARGVTHLHCHWPYASKVGCLVHRLTGISYSVSIHAHEVAHEADHFPEVFSSVKFATFCNRAAMEYLLARLPAGARTKSHLIYHGVDLAAFRASTMPAIPPLRVVSAGRLTATKGFDRLVRACAAARNAGVALELEVLGDGSQMGALRSLAGELGFDPARTFPGWVEQREVTARLQRAHVFALLADDGYHDGLPNVVLEAMACARPVIVSRIPAASEAIDSGTEGFVLEEVRNPGRFIAVCRELVENPAALGAMGHAARMRIERDFGAQPCLQRLVELIGECK